MDIILPFVTHMLKPSVTPSNLPTLTPATKKNMSSILSDLSHAHGTDNQCLCWIYKGVEFRWASRNPCRGDTVRNGRYKIKDYMCLWSQWEIHIDLLFPGFCTSLVKENENVSFVCRENVDLANCGRKMREKQIMRSQTHSPHLLGQSSKDIARDFWIHLWPGLLLPLLLPKRANTKDHRRPVHERDATNRRPVPSCFCSQRRMWIPEWPWHVLPMR